MDTLTAIIRKDGFIKSRPWTIDLMIEGRLWKGWACGFKTRQAAEGHCVAVEIDYTTKD